MWTAFILVAAAVLLPRPTQACSCAVAPSEPYPENDSTVPSNAKFWLPWMTAFRNLPPDRQRQADRSVPWDGGHGPAVSARDVARAHHLVGPAGETIPFSVSTLAIGRGRRPAYFILTPARPLEPGTHSIRVALATPGSFEMSVNVEARTLAVAPDPPRVQFRALSSPGERNTCVDDFRFPFTATHDGIITILGLTEDLTPVPDHSAWVSDVFDSRDGIVGSAACRSNWNFHRGPIFARLATVDIAGNFSGWTAPVQLEVPRETFDAWDKEVVARSARDFQVPPRSARGCGCTLLPGHSSGFIPAYLVFGLLWLRRRSPRSENRHRRCSPAQPALEPDAGLGKLGARFEVSHVVAPRRRPFY